LSELKRYAGERGAPAPRDLKTRRGRDGRPSGT
jgi:hypothetical protein